MELKKNELDDLEEQLILLYRFVVQNNTLKKFYYEGVDIKPSFKDETGILTELIKNEDSEGILKTCIMELEESKGTNEEVKKEEKEFKKFHEVLNSYDIELLYKKYGMSGVEDVDKLNLKKIVGSL